MIIKSTRIWDGISGEYFAGALQVQDGVIARVDRGSGPVPSVCEEGIDFGDDVVMPSLIDCHVHLVWSGSGDPVRVVEAEGEQRTTLRAAGHARRQLYAGVQAVRDLGSNWDIALSVAASIEDGITVGPMVVASGRTIIMTGGHDSFWGIAANGPAECLAAVRKQWARGARVIKVAASGGVYGRAAGEEVGQSELTGEELRVIVGEAHRLGLRVASHAVGATGVLNSVLAGVDSVEHGAFLTEEAATRMREQGVFLCPTALVYERIAAGEGGVPEYAARKAREVVEAQGQAIRMAQELGVKIIAGTDAGSCGTPHPSLVGEMTTLQSKGLEAVDVLRGATSLAAEALGVADMVGILAAGRWANVVVVSGDPLQDVRALAGIRAVMFHGVVLQ